MPEVNAYIEQGNRVLGALGYTEHSRGHAVKVAETAGNILDKLGYNQHTIELAKIAGYITFVYKFPLSLFAPALADEKINDEKESHKGRQ